MKADNLVKVRSERVWLTKDQCDIEGFRAIVEQTTNPADYPFAAGVEKNVLVYDGDAVRKAAADPETRKALLAELLAGLGASTQHPLASALVADAYEGSGKVKPGQTVTPVAAGSPSAS